MFIHPQLKLGKQAPKIDKRTLRLASLFRPSALPVPPAYYNYDQAHPQLSFPLPMFGNNKLGDCVMAGRGHQTLRFESAEQGSLIPITDNDITTEYFRESGGADSGLVVLDSLNAWRRGWTAAGKKYTITAFASVNTKDHVEVKLAISLLSGLGLGLSLPVTASDQVNAGKWWSVVPHAGESGIPGSWGGHYVYALGYSTKGVLVVTWGQYQWMTWAFFDKYCDEAYVILDARDSWRAAAPGVDFTLLAKYLSEIQAA